MWVDAPIGYMATASNWASQNSESIESLWGKDSEYEIHHFIGKDIRLEPVMIGRDHTSGDLLEFYMGKNTPKRQEFIIENLRVEKNLEEELFN